MQRCGNLLMISVYQVCSYVQCHSFHMDYEVLLYSFKEVQSPQLFSADEQTDHT